MGVCSRPFTVPVASNGICARTVLRNVSASNAVPMVAVEHVANAHPALHVTIGEAVCVNRNAKVRNAEMTGAEAVAVRAPLVMSVMPTVSVSAIPSARTNSVVPTAVAATAAPALRVPSVLRAASASRVAPISVEMGFVRSHLGKIATVVPRIVTARVLAVMNMISLVAMTQT